MKCTECLPVIEEYYDGELDERNSEAVAAHLAACAECSEALEALNCEQSFYARYQPDIEITPALWQTVRARIDEERTAPAALAPLPLFVRLRRSLSETFGFGRIFTPAFATSFAFVAVCTAAAVIGYLHMRDTEPGAQLAVQTGNPVGMPALNTVESPPAASVTDNGTPAAAEELDASPNVSGPPSGPTAPIVQATVGAERKFASRRLIETASAPRPSALNGRRERANDTSVAGDEAAHVSSLLDPEEREVARHIERAQLLLRSFRNAGYAETEEVSDVAYEKRLSRQLLNENILLRRDAETVGNPSAKQLLNTLEPFLLDIANMQDKPSRDDVRSIKERMQRTEIIAALQVY